MTGQSIQSDVEHTNHCQKTPVIHIQAAKILSPHWSFAVPCLVCDDVAKCLRQGEHQLVVAQHRSLVFQRLERLPQSTLLPCLAIHKGLKYRKSVNLKKQGLPANYLPQRFHLQNACVQLWWIPIRWVTTSLDAKIVNTNGAKPSLAFQAFQMRILYSEILWFIWKWTHQAMTHDSSSCFPTGIPDSLGG